MDNDELVDALAVLAGRRLRLVAELETLQAALAAVDAAIDALDAVVSEPPSEPRRSSRGNRAMMIPARQPPSTAGRTAAPPEPGPRAEYPALAPAEPSNGSKPRRGWCPACRSHVASKQHRERCKGALNAGAVEPPAAAPATPRAMAECLDCHELFRELAIKDGRCRACRDAKQRRTCPTCKAEHGNERRAGFCDCGLAYGNGAHRKRGCAAATEPPETREKSPPILRPKAFGTLCRSCGCHPRSNEHKLRCIFGEQGDDAAAEPVPADGHHHRLVFDPPGGPLSRGVCVGSDCPGDGEGGPYVQYSGNSADAIKRLAAGETPEQILAADAALMATIT